MPASAPAPADVNMGVNMDVDDWKHEPPTAHHDIAPNPRPLGIPEGEHPADDNNNYEAASWAAARDPAYAGLPPDQRAAWYVFNLERKVRELEEEIREGRAKMPAWMWKMDEDREDGDAQ